MIDKEMEEQELSDDQPAELIRLELPASHKHVNLVSACVAALLEREERLIEREQVIHQVELAIHETCINIVEHAYLNHPGRIVVNLLIMKNPRKLVVDLYDTGIPFDMTKIIPPKTEEARVRGYGLSLIHQIMENVTYVVESERNHWRLEKNL